MTVPAQIAQIPDGSPRAAPFYIVDANGNPITSGNPLSIMNAQALGQNTMQNSTPVVIASDQSPVQMDDSAVQGMVNISAINGAGTPGPQLSATLNSGADNTITFATKVRRVILHNQSAVNVPFEHDLAAVAVSPYLAPGQLVALGVHTTVLHVFPSNALPINAANGLIVRGWA